MAILLSKSDGFVFRLKKAGVLVLGRPGGMRGSTGEDLGGVKDSDLDQDLKKVSRRKKLRLV